MRDRSQGRPATLADAHAIHQLVAARERALIGRAETGLDAITADLTLPAVDLALDTLLVHDPAGELAGWAWVHGGRRSTVDVHPDHQGRGLGAGLLDWAEARAPATRQRTARADGPGRRSGGGRPAALARVPAVRHPVVAGDRDRRRARGARAAAGHHRAAVPPRRRRAAYQLTEDAFDEWQLRRKSYEEWALHTVERATFAPDVSTVAFAGDQMVGAVLALDVPGSGEGYVERVAVRRDHRDRGIARLLLRASFRGFHLRGQQTCTLWTHSKTGALSLYERVGMTVRRSSSVYGRGSLAPRACLTIAAG